MVKEETSGAVRILRQTKSTGTEMSPPCEPYSARHNSTFIVTQNAAIRKKCDARNHAKLQVDGMFKTWPARIRAGFMSGLAATSALSFTPYLRAMPTAVSPAATVCVRGAAMVAGLRRMAAPVGARAGAETFCAVCGWTGLAGPAHCPVAARLVLAAARLAGVIRAPFVHLVLQLPVLLGQFSNCCCAAGALGNGSTSAASCCLQR